MESLTTFLESGLLELYAMGATSPEETQTVEQMVAQHPAAKAELEAITQSLEAYAMTHAVEPNQTVKPLFLATIDYMDRMQKGEVPVSPPELGPHTTVADFEPWLSRPELNVPDLSEDIYVKIIGYTPAATTAIVWLKSVAPQEIHHDELECFFILEGTCTITVEDQPHYLKPGDFFAIPLYKTHSVQVTSEVPCKVILQRLAA
ncbi:cupin domain-containing protein [Rufibacter sp. LB8]|uniref:cupin domain-containing protein n=1 Tax=Rufibacter sp. LB8 TaxID=2777781 RepID=UPI00178C283B|nr:cupin domain-containing protein [Rufibacter sp. LB8]